VLCCTYISRLFSLFQTGVLHIRVGGDLTSSSDALHIRVGGDLTSSSDDLHIRVGGDLTSSSDDFVFHANNR
jgi:hypothetical protein